MGAALAAMLLLAAAPATAECAPEGRVQYLCGPQKPEDIVAIDGRRWLVASGFATGAGLKLVDARRRTAEPWFTGEAAQIAPRTSAAAACPGPVDPALFNARGLSLRKTGRNRWRLLVVNHGGRESIEMFDVEMAGGKPALRWRDCIPMPPGQVANSVASFADGTILTTVLTRPGTTIADFVEGRTTGAVWQWRPGESGFSELPGTELPGNNGLEVDSDDRHFHVVAFGWHSLVTFDRRDTRVPVARMEAPGFMPDNVHWTNGRLLLAGMRLDEPACGGRRRVIDGVADQMRCHRGWVVGEVDRRTGGIRILKKGEPLEGFNGISAAAILGGELWLGSYQSDRIAIVPLGDGISAD